MEARIGGAWREIIYGEVYINGAWRRLKYAEGYISGAWRQIANFIEPLTLDVSPPAPSKFGTSDTITSNTVTATPTGGLAPFTYSWVRTSGSTDIDVNSPAAASTTFTGAGLDADTLTTATFTCTVTDALGSTADDTCSPSFYYSTTGGA